MRIIKDEQFVHGFTRSIPDRCFAAFLSLLLMVPTAWGLFMYFTIDHSRDDPDWRVRLFLHVCMELIGVAFLLSVLGFLWSIFTPRWLTRLSQFLQRYLVRGLNSVLLVVVLMFAVGTLALLTFLGMMAIGTRLTP